MGTTSRRERCQRRHRRVRRKIFGTAERPRMAVDCSNRGMRVQFVDDERGLTLAAAALDRSGERPNVAGARNLGRRAAEAARAKGIERAVFDRGGFKFHARLRALVEAAVTGGVVIGKTRVAVEEVGEGNQP